jgi:nitrite reductase/ring-hydroxylating ferredoxin subunit
MAPDEWTKLASVEDCPAGRAKFVTVGDVDLAIFHLANPDGFVVTRNSCPHAGGSLATGDIEGHTVTCPWHHWAFDLDTGRCINAENVTLRRYPCRLEDGYVSAKLPGL